MSKLKFHIVESCDLIFVSLVLAILDYPKTVRYAEDADVIICNSGEQLLKMHEEHPEKFCILYASAYGDSELPINCMLIKSNQTEKLKRISKITVHELNLEFSCAEQQSSGQLCLT